MVVDVYLIRIEEVERVGGNELADALANNNLLEDPEYISAVPLYIVKEKMRYKRVLKEFFDKAVKFTGGDDNIYVLVEVV